MDDKFKDMPQLAVGLDSLDDSANYIFILDAQDGKDYYCPCCKGLIKPRAYKKDINYQVQPHFYHVNGGCSEETYIHYICKTWLFEKGCRFIVSGTTYEVENVEIEKTLHTSFGDYRPDIIVTTTSDKVFYFEIKVTNKKTDFYQPKWDELGNDIVEVDTRYFINQKFKNNIPEFNLIYSDGECFIKSYSRTDYEDVIAKRKAEWKRQDKINYKIQWERLDWFWIEMQEYKQGNKTLDYVFSMFEKLDLFDKEICFDLLKRQSCIKSSNQQFRDIINKESIEYWNNNAKNMIGHKIKFISCDLKPRSEIYIWYTFLTDNGYRDNNYLKHNNREWIIRPSIIVEVIKQIQHRILYVNCEAKNKDVYENIISKVFKCIFDKVNSKHSIWNLKFFQYHNTLTIGIKNGFCNQHSTNLCVDYDSFRRYLQVKSEEILSEDLLNNHMIYKFVTHKLECEMNKIRDYVIKNDGLDSEYRHMFVNKNKENN